MASRLSTTSENASGARWDVILTSVASGKVVLGIVNLAVASIVGDPPAARLLLMLAHVASFAIAGAILLIGGRRDPRARLLAITFLVTASVFADPLMIANDSVRRVIMIQPYAFSTFFLWQFVRAFPQVPQGPVAARRFASIITVCLWSGIALFIANGSIALAPHFDHPARWLEFFSRRSAGGAFWIIQGALTLPALPVLAWKTGRATADERRRATLLVTALAIGTIPTIYWVFLQAISPTFARLLPLRVVGWVLYPTLLSTPFTTAFAVLTRRALDVRLVVRRALQYALARYSVLTVATVPVLLFVVLLYQRRDESLGRFFTTPAELGLLVLAMGGILVMRGGGDVMSRIDRRFFREQYDSRRILGQLVEQCRSVGDAGELARIVETEVDRALHVDVARVFLLSTEIRSLVPPDGGMRPLPMDSGLARLLAESSGPVDVDLEHPAPKLRQLDPDETHWLLDGGFRLLFPVREESRMIGLLALGEKRSELPFSHEDVNLLGAVTGAMEMAIAYRRLQSVGTPRDESPGMAAVAEVPASECASCGTVQPSGIAKCARCGSHMVVCPLPQVVGGKFLLDQRIGAGGMGVVYRGMDVHLGRLVAIKTLPTLTPGEAVRLRREARTTASLTHRNLAMIYGAEMWHGQPVLVFEYLSGGTLADKLKAGPLPLSSVVDLGISLASLLTAVHELGVLHLDIKPSNIGFAPDGTPKLLDFGLARIMSSIGAERHEAGTTIEGMALLKSASASESLVQGTPLYMSPEALRGRRPDATFDVWSLTVTLFEALAGRPLWNDFRAVRRAADLESEPFDIRGAAPDLSPALIEFFTGALSPRLAERPRSAGELAERLARLMTHFSSWPEPAARSFGGASNTEAST